MGEGLPVFGRWVADGHGLCVGWWGGQERPGRAREGGWRSGVWGGWAPCLVPRAVGKMRRDIPEEAWIFYLGKASVLGECGHWRRGARFPFAGGGTVAFLGAREVAKKSTKYLGRSVHFISGKRFVSK